MYASGVKVAYCDQQTLDDGYTRTFRGAEIPEFSVQELNMLHEWRDEGKFDEVVIFLSSEKYKNLDEEITGLVFREMLRGNL